MLTFLERLGVLMVKTHISTFSDPYLNRKRYGSQEVEIWVSAEWSEMSRHEQTATSREMAVYTCIDSFLPIRCTYNQTYLLVPGTLLLKVTDSPVPSAFTSTPTQGGMGVEAGTAMGLIAVPSSFIT